MTDQNELAVVSGGAGAIGQVIVRRLMLRGLDMLVVGRRETELKALAARDKGIRICAADLADDSAIEKVAQAIDRPVRMVVHCVGVPVAGGVMEAAPDALAQAVNVKAGGFLRLARAVDPHLVKHARLVAIGGHYGLEPTAYAATAGVGNAALMALSRQLSLAYGPRGVTSHVVAPGPADTDRLRQVASARAARDGLTVDEVFREMLRESSLGAFTTPGQVAWAVANLLDEEADSMTGSTLMLDSGRRRGLP